MNKTCNLQDFNFGFIDNCCEIANKQFWLFDEAEYQEYKRFLLFGV